MTYDSELADRLRELLTGRGGIAEKKMFGGLAFMVDGHMTVCAGSRGALMVRADPDRMAELLADPRARPMEMRGRPLRGWLLVDIGSKTPDDELRLWVDVGLDFVDSLPAKE